MKVKDSRSHVRDHHFRNSYIIGHLFNYFNDWEIKYLFFPLLFAYLAACSGVTLYLDETMLAL